MTQEERLDYLVEQFSAETGGYRPSGGGREARKRILRSLMNVRMPGPMDPETVRVQDEYLRETARERGIVTAAELPTTADQYGKTVPCADRLSLWRGDITRLAADAIVNAANSQMLGCFIPCHSCIDNCIHTYAGIELRAECAQQMAALRKRYGGRYEQPVAVPMLTGGYNLPAKHVIHIVGPIVDRDVTPELREQLADCYRRTLDLCLEHGFSTVAFCCISTGVFRFPKDRAAEIAVRTVTQWLARHNGGNLDRIVFNVFGAEDFQLYGSLLSGKGWD